ncbi:MAG: tetratricopeptide repeat protein, partial [Deltaproteobacteria bacterium]
PAIERAVEIADIPSAPGRRAARRALRVAFAREGDEAGDEATTRETALVLRRLLAARAQLRGIALVVDGVELADRHSRAVLTELLRRPPSGPLLVVLALRDTDDLARESAHTRVLLLGPLSETARGALVARRLGADSVAPDLLREVSAVAGGNPLMILEVIEALGDRGRIELDGDEGGSRVVLSAARDGELPLPATLEEVLASRIDALPPEARTLARWCALIEQEMPVDLLEAIAGRDAPRAIGRLISDGILVNARGRRDTLAFAHTALAKVARNSIDPTQIAGMHARIAAALERQPSSRGIGAGAIARHREAAGAIRPAARAYLEAAGAHRLASQHREALEGYARVLVLTAESVDPEGFALRVAANSGREEIARGAGRTRARRTEILAMRSNAVDAKDPRLIGRALARQARYKLETGLGTGIERDVAAATRAARRAGELRTEAEAKRVLGVHLGQRGRYAEALQAAEEALAALDTRSALAPPPGGTADDGVRAARTVRVEILIAKGALLRQTGEVDGAIEVYAEAYAVLSRFGPRRLLAHTLNNLGVACLSRGDYADALRLFLGSIAVHRESG